MLGYAMRAGARRSGLRLLPILVVALIGLSACVVPPPPIADGAWEVAFSDGFDGPTLNPNWSEFPYGDSLPATVSGGLLTLRTTAAHGYQSAHLATTGPRIDAEPSYPYAASWEQGYVEARLRYSNDRWARPAVWMFSMAKSEAWPEENCAHLTSEWDIIENGIEIGDGSRPANNWLTSVVHRNSRDGTPDGYCGVPDVRQWLSEPFWGVNLSDWHTWAGRWTANELCTYLDDVLIHCLPTYDTTAQPMHLVLTMSYLGRCDGCPPPPPELTMQVDWVRVWQPT